MAKMTEEEEQAHFAECPAVQKRPVDRGPCRCAALAAEENDYYSEPTDMADRENGFIN